MEDSNPDLETFRQQWRAEVMGRTKGDNNNKKTKSDLAKQQPRKQAFEGKSSSKGVKSEETNDTSERQALRRLSSHNRADHELGESSKKDASNGPKSALDHYEKAVERENQGNLGDSLDLYRKAFRMDDQVDKIYRRKHFPASSFPSKTVKEKAPGVSTTVTNPERAPLDGSVKSTKELIASFSSLKIEPAPPFIDGMDPLPCPLAKLPDEIIVHILEALAVQDVGAFTKTAQVCRRLAFIVMTEEQIWRRICHSFDFGFPAMHYKWQCEVFGGPLKAELEAAGETDDEEYSNDTPSLDKGEITDTLYKDNYSMSWQKMFRFRPRIRFNGCYISTVNYIRAGQAAQTATTWSSPVHIVTYFRYLRFFRDGTVISLLTTAEPADVVHHLTKALQETHRKGAAAHLPSIFMQNALKGRWRLSSINDDSEASLKDAEGDVFVETEGANEKYLYRMKFSLANAGKTVRNNKLTWQGFWCYNVLTDDTGEFPLKNDKAYLFSRVKSYGLGE